MFKQNKYTTWYFNIIEHAKANQAVIITSYHEKHHIIPKSMGGTNKPSNIVCLTARQHFICHWLLIYMVDRKYLKKLTYALWAMCNKHNKHQKRHTLNSHTYEKIKIISANQQRSDKKGKTLEELYGNEKAASIREKFKTRRHRSKMTLEEKVEVSERTKRRSKETPWKRNFQTRDIIPTKTCPHCGKIVDYGNFSRWHGDACRTLSKPGK